MQVPAFSKLGIVMVLSWTHGGKDHVRFDVRTHDSVDVGKVHDGCVLSFVLLALCSRAIVPVSMGVLGHCPDLGRNNGNRCW